MTPPWWWPWGRRTPAPAANPRRRGLLGRFLRANPPAGSAMDAVISTTGALLPRAATAADAACGGAGAGYKNGLSSYGLGRGPGSVAANEAILGFFAGHAMPMPFSVCAHLSAHWLIDKACRIPARDAVRQGWVLDVADEERRRKIERADKRMRVAWNLEQFVALGRVYGIRILMFEVQSGVAGYYEHPFNPDGVTPGSYKGIVQVDPQWCAPDLTNANLDPSRAGFYEPEFWRVGDRRVHKSHLVIFRNGELPDVLKPAYGYGGVSVPQRIVERVYSAERTANEASQLAMAKRVSVWKTDLGEAEMGGGKLEAHFEQWRAFLDNWGVKMADHDDSYEQHDTSLADFDAVVMNQYQLVAAGANMPAAKLLGTTPKGFNATGEYEEGVYHEELESIQTHDLTPVLDRHYLLLARSNGIAEEIDYTWEALDTPTAAEYAEIELKRAQRDAQIAQTGAIDAVDVRDRLRKDRNGDYFGIERGVLDDSGTDPLTSPSGFGGGEDDERRPEEY